MNLKVPFAPRVSVCIPRLNDAANCQKRREEEKRSGSSDGSLVLRHSASSANQIIDGCVQLSTGGPPSSLPP